MFSTFLRISKSREQCGAEGDSWCHPLQTKLALNSLPTMRSEESQGCLVPGPGAMGWTACSLAWVKVAQPSLLRELGQLGERSPCTRACRTCAPRAVLGESDNRPSGMTKSRFLCSFPRCEYSDRRQVLDCTSGQPRAWNWQARAHNGNFNASVSPRVTS